MDCHAVFKTARNDKALVILSATKYPQKQGVSSFFWIFRFLVKAQNNKNGVKSSNFHTKFSPQSFQAPL